jgi:hypothetical protein
MPLSPVALISSGNKRADRCPPIIFTMELYWKSLRIAMLFASAAFIQLKASS